MINILNVQELSRRKTNKLPTKGGKALAGNSPVRDCRFPIHIQKNIQLHSMSGNANYFKFKILCPQS